MESVSRVASVLETARDLTVEAAQSAGAARSFNTRAAIRDVPFTQIKKLLDSRHDREVLEGLRKVISMMYRSKSCLPFFSSVVKNVASPNIEIKKLVYIYLLHHAESEPDLALLSINTIQKSLSDQDPQVRAMALRVMSGIRVPVISQIVSLAIKKGCADMSPHVRKAAALAIPKCYRLDPGTLPQLTDYLSLLLGDKQYYVVGSAVMAFLEVCPENIDLIHKHYRALIRKLVDMDEWGQLALIRLMTYYARKCFPRPAAVSESKQRASNEPASNKNLMPGSKLLDPDLEHFLKSCKTLLTSRNASVVISVARCYLYVGTTEYLREAVGPAIALLRTSQAFHHVVLCDLVAICLAIPQDFVPYYGQFLIKSTDSLETLRMKLELLTLIFPEADEQTKAIILSELEHFTISANKDIVRESVRAIGRCAHFDTGTSKRCLNLLLGQASSPDGALVAEALNVVRRLIQQDPASHTNTVIRLAKNLDTMIDSQARASVIWLVGEFAGVEEDDIAPDVLRILVRGFAAEEEPARLQIVLLAAKVYTHHLNKFNNAKSDENTQERVDAQAHGEKSEGGEVEGADEDREASRPDVELNTKKEQVALEPDSDHPIAKIWQYVLLLARYDTSYDLRDRTRLFTALLSKPSSTQLANLLLLAPKPIPTIPSPSESRSDLLLGSSSLVIGSQAGMSGLSGYEPLPPWVEVGQEPLAVLREESQDEKGYDGPGAISASQKLDLAMQSRTSTLQPKAAGKAKAKTLDDWLAEEDGTGQNETYTETESGSDEEETEEETDEEESEEETEDENEEARSHDGDETQKLVQSQD